MRLWLALLGVFLLYAAVCFTVSRLIYRPTRYPRGWWHTQADCNARDMWLQSSDGVSLHAWWVESPGSRLATLYLHGNGANLSHRPGHLREMAAAGTSVLLIDYRGYGKSAGRPTERGLYRDADAGYDRLVAMGYRPHQIVVHGESLGSAVAADLAARRPCAGLVLECPLTSLSAMAARIVPWLGGLFATGFNTRRKVAQVRVPLLVMHGDRDRTVPYAMGREVFAAGNQPKTFWTVPGATHKTIVQDGGLRYRATLRAFYESLADKQLN
ncbi:MAG TPA: alpha/beta hydrolase [Bryobacteraceae bacterium]|nr:alpha/beta hydrolase [Bryobacteraceae bacterium]